jgi:CubicO group peptidase (beta-lactamase class C family)
MTKSPILITLLFLLLFTFTPIYAQVTSAQIDSIVEDARKKFNVAGVALAIVKDGEVIHSKGYGVKSVDTQEKVDQHTQFAIASNTKAFTSAALAILVEEGKITWLDKVVDHIPEFKMYNSYVTENFNIQDLLTHRSGLGLGIGDLMIFPDGADFTIDDLLVSFQHFKPESALRTKFDYDNLLYIVAGEIIARKSGMTWEAFVMERFFEPLGMDNTFPSADHIKDKSNLASPHNTPDGELNALPDYQMIMNGAPGGIYSSVDDLCNWMMLQLNRGKYGDDLSLQLFSERNHDEMWRIHTPLNVGRNLRYNSHFSGYGLGWFLTDMLGNMSVSHTGGLPGMLSKTSLIPDMNLGIVILTNTEPGGGALFTAIERTIVDSYLGLDDFQWVDKYAESMKSRLKIGDEVTEKVWATVAEANDDHINPNDYIGVYEDPWFGKGEVFMKEDQLFFKSYRSPKLNGPMAYYKANTFAIKWEYQDMNADAFAMFQLDENGRAVGIKMKGISPNIDFSFDFHDLDFKRIE